MLLLYYATYHVLSYLICCIYLSLHTHYHSLSSPSMYVQELLSGLASSVASNEEEIMDAFDSYDAHLEEIFSRMTV